MRAVRARPRQHLSRLWRAATPAGRGVRRRATRLRHVALSTPAASPSRFERAFAHPAAASALEQQLAPLARRLRRQRVWRHLPRAVALGAVLALVLVLGARVFGLPGLAFLALPVALGACLASLLVVVRRPIGPFETALRTDLAFNLRERLSTALELLETGRAGGLVERQVQDALLALSRVRPDRAFPLFPHGSEPRRSALRTASFSVAALAGALILALWVPAGGVPGPARAERELLALADPNQPPAVMRLEPAPRSVNDPGDAVEGRTRRPDEIGQAPGLLGEPQRGDADTSTTAPAPADRSAQRDASAQTSGSVQERAEALQDLGNALRQTQTARSAGEALRAGETQRAAQQLAQVGDQVKSLSPGERQALSQAFRQAAEQIGEKDRALARSAAQAADALQQFRNQEAQTAIRDAAKQVQETGQQVQAQRDLADRQQQLQSGGQPALPAAQSNQVAPGDLQRQQQSRAGADQAGQRPTGPASRTEAGQVDAPARSQRADLAQLERDLREGLAGQGQGQSQGQSQGQGQTQGPESDEGATAAPGSRSGQSGSSGAGAGTGAGQWREGAPQRLNITARPELVDAEAGAGPNRWAPPNPNAPPAPPPAVPAVPGGPASTQAVGAGLDLNTVPLDLLDPVRQYFTPEQK